MCCKTGLKSEKDELLLGVSSLSVKQFLESAEGFAADPCPPTPGAVSRWVIVGDRHRAQYYGFFCLRSHTRLRQRLPPEWAPPVDGPRSSGACVHDGRGWR